MRLMDYCPLGNKLNMKSEHLTFTTALIILGMVVGTVVYYYERADVADGKMIDLTSQVKAESTARLNADMEQTKDIERNAAAMAIFNRNMVRFCNRLGIECETINP